MTPKMTMSELVDMYLERRSSQLGAQTQRKVRSRLSRLAAWFDDKKPRRVPKSLTVSELEEYVWGRHVCGPRCSGSGRFHAGSGVRTSCEDSTFVGVMSSLTDFLAWASRRGFVSPELVDVTHRTGVKVKRKRQLRLTSDQLMDVVTGSPDPWTRIVCALGVFTAGRSAELLSVRVGDVDLDDWTIDWSRHKTGDDTDQLPITSDLAGELKLWFDFYEVEAGPLRPNHYLIPRRMMTRHPGQVFEWVYYPDQPRGGRLHQVVKEQVARVLSCPVSDLKQQGVHTLRRSMARALYERLRAENQGDPMGVVQALLGHSARSMTERYIGVESSREERDSILRGRSMFGG